MCPPSRSGPAGPPPRRAPAISSTRRCWPWPPAGPGRQPGHQVEVLPAGHGRLDGRVLAGQADLPADRPGLAAHVVAGHPELPRVGAQQGGHGAHEGRLAAPSGRGREDVAGFGHQVEAVEGHRLPVPLGEAVGLDRRRHLHRSANPGHNPEVTGPQAIVVAGVQGQGVAAVLADHDRRIDLPDGPPGRLSWAPACSKISTKAWAEPSRPGGSGAFSSTMQLSMRKRPEQLKRVRPGRPDGGGCPEGGPPLRSGHLLQARRDADGRIQIGAARMQSRCGAVPVEIRHRPGCRSKNQCPGWRRAGRWSAGSDRCACSRSRLP